VKKNSARANSVCVVSAELMNDLSLYSLTALRGEQIDFTFLQREPRNQFKIPRCWAAAIKLLQRKIRSPSCASRDSMSVNEKCRDYIRIKSPFSLSPEHIDSSIRDDTTHAKLKRDPYTINGARSDISAVYNSQDIHKQKSCRANQLS
jgi:hypothetical protein